MPIKVLSAGAVKRGVSQIAQQYETASGHAVSVEFDTAPIVRDRLRAGDDAHVVVLPPPMLDELAREGRIDNGHRGHIGRSRVGLFVKRDVALPDISTVEAFADVLTRSDAVIYNTASSGLYIEQLLARLGLHEVLAARIEKVSSGAAVMEKVAAHSGGAIGFGQLSEIRVQLDKGVAIALVGPLPEEIQNSTPYDAAVASVATKVPGAAELVAALTSSAARAVFRATGID